MTSLPVDGSNMAPSGAVPESRVSTPSAANQFTNVNNKREEVRRESCTSQSLAFAAKALSFIGGFLLGVALAAAAGIVAVSPAGWAMAAIGLAALTILAIRHCVCEAQDTKELFINMVAWGIVGVGSIFIAIGCAIAKDNLFAPAIKGIVGALSKIGCLKPAVSAAQVVRHAAPAARAVVRPAIELAPRVMRHAPEPPKVVEKQEEKGQVAQQNQQPPETTAQKTLKQQYDERVAKRNQRNNQV